jgi:hypothetical protein
MTNLPHEGKFEEKHEGISTEFKEKRIFTPLDQLEFIKYRVAVLTEEDRSNPLETKFHNSYHKIQFVLDQNLFFTKNVHTGHNWETIPVEYQVLYITAPLQGFLPWVSVNFTDPPPGQFTPNGPDHVMSAEVWLLGIVLDAMDKYPGYVSRQSPWFRANSTVLYRK